MYLIFEVSTTNISRVFNINMAKRDWVWLQNEEYFEYCPNDLCLYAHYLDAHVYKIKVFNNKYLSTLNRLLTLFVSILS